MSAPYKLSHGTPAAPIEAHPEPQGEPFDARRVLLVECDEADADMRKWVRVPVKFVRAALRSAQGEPSDAQRALSAIQEIVDAYPADDHRYAPGYPIRDIRAALRAASAVTEQGENR